MNFFSYIIFRAFSLKIRFIPFALLYITSDVLRFILKNVFRYRTGVIKKNVAFCLPNISPEQVNSIANSFYVNFVDIVLESMKGFSYDPKKMISRYRLINPDILDPYFENQQSVIILSQHYNNWEWGSICLGLQTQHHIVGVIKKISNKYIHAFVAKARSRNNVSVVNADDAAKYIRYHKPNKPEALVLIADQYPYNKRHRTAAQFFDHDIDFHSGTGLIASWTDCPIFSIDIHKVKRGHYKLELVKLVDKASDSTPQEITKLYARHLESLIRKSPHSWLWSHKRFKDNIEY